MRNLLLVMWAWMALGVALQAQDTVVVKDDYPLAVQEAQAGKKVVLMLYETEELELPKVLDKDLQENLVGLLCDNCHLKSFPEGLEDCPNLSAVEINWYLFEESFDNSVLLGQVFQVPYLKALRVHAFPMPDLPFKSRALELLEWTKGGLTSLPAWVYAQTDLKVLRLGCNALESLGEELGQLKQLKQLSLDGGACGGNPIKSLPATIGQLSQLKSFSLSYGKLEILPAALVQLPQLKSLFLHYAGVATLPDVFSKTSALKSFSISAGEEFLGFPPSFQQLSLKNLRVDVYQPTCQALQSRAALEVMGRKMEDYEVSFRGDYFPHSVDNTHVTNQMLGVWKAKAPFSLFPKATEGLYLFLNGSRGYLSNTIEGMPAKGEFGKAVYDYEQAHAVYTFKDLQYHGACVFGRGEEANSPYAPIHFIHFSFDYEQEKEVLTLTLGDGKVVELVR